MDGPDSHHVTYFLCCLRYATIELCFLCVVGAERIWEVTGMRIDFTWVPKFQGNSNVATRYVCCSYSNLESVRTKIQTRVLITETRDSIMVAEWVRMKWAGRVGGGEVCTLFCSENLSGRVHLEDRGLDVRITLEWLLCKQGETM
jgi:hypothetical protein